jgi:membrane protease subunit HflC
MRTLILILLAILALFALRSCLYAVDAGEFVYLTQFGRHVATYDGGNPEEAGLHFKWPWPIESVLRIDRRLQYLDLPGAELLTRDKERGTIDQTLAIDAYVAWRIPTKEDVDLFIRKVGTIAGAQALLDRDVNNELGAAIGQMELADLISVVPGKVDRQRERLRHLLLDQPLPGSTQSLRNKARGEYGIELVDIRLRRSNHPPAVRPAIFERIISERERKVAEYESRGERMAAEIRSQTELEVGKLKANAEGRAIEVRGKADGAADRILNDTALQRPEFYAFLKELEDLQRLLSTGKTVLLLSTKRFKTLSEPPVAPPGAPPVAPMKGM